MYPMWPIELYAKSLLIFVCPIAATAPRIIEAMDKNITISCHSDKIILKGTSINRIITAIPAIFGTTAKKFVTEVGEPSYTSGVHI